MMARVPNRRLLIVVSIVLLVATIAGVVRNQLRVAEARKRRASELAIRQALFDRLVPVALSNCRLERFGEENDGGYLMCANLLDDVQSAYSYGISGYDKWGCDVSTRLRIPLHQYDCFNATRPACPDGRPIFHDECVGPSRETREGRLFDAIAAQVATNQDDGKRLVMKMDVEGAEWESLQSAPDALFDRIDQLVLEFHWGQDAEHRWVFDPRHVALLERLQRFFHVAHVHFNNASCTEGLAPFPTWAYEVTFVSKRLAELDASRTPVQPHPLDAPNNPRFAECQASGLVASAP